MQSMKRPYIILDEEVFVFIASPYDTYKMTFQQEGNKSLWPTTKPITFSFISKYLNSLSNNKNVHFCSIVLVNLSIRKCG